jgi:hypothetical protein
VNYDQMIAALETEKKQLADRVQALTGQILGLKELDLADKEREDRQAGLVSQRNDASNQLEKVSDEQRGLKELRENPPEVTYEEIKAREPPPRGETLQPVDEFALANGSREIEDNFRKLRGEIDGKGAEHLEALIEKDFSDAHFHSQTLDLVDGANAALLTVAMAAGMAVEWSKRKSHEKEEVSPSEQLTVDLRDKSGPPRPERQADNAPQLEQSPQEQLERAKLEDLIKRGVEAVDKRYEHAADEERTKAQEKFQERFDEMRRELDEKWAKVHEDAERKQQLEQERQTASERWVPQQVGPENPDHARAEREDAVHLEQEHRQQVQQEREAASEKWVPQHVGPENPDHARAEREAAVQQEAEPRQQKEQERKAAEEKWQPQHVGPENPDAAQKEREDRAREVAEEAEQRRQAQARRREEEGRDDR